MDDWNRVEPGGGIGPVVGVLAEFAGEAFWDLAEVLRLIEDLTEVDQKVGLSGNGITSSTDKSGLRVARLNRA